MKVGVGDEHIGPEQHPVANLDALVGYQHGARRAAVVADDDDRSAAPGGQHDRLEGPERVGAGGGAQLEPVTQGDAAASMALENGHAENPPPAAPAHPGQGEPEPDPWERKDPPEVVVGL